jgi:hypothetical protein
VRQAVTGRQLKPVHRVNTAGRIPSCVDRNDHPILVEDIELRLVANGREYPRMVRCSIAAGWIGGAARLM